MLENKYNFQHTWIFQILDNVFQNLPEFVTSIKTALLMPSLSWNGIHEYCLKRSRLAQYRRAHKQKT